MASISYPDLARFLWIAGTTPATVRTASRITGGRAGTERIAASAKPLWLFVGLDALNSQAVVLASCIQDQSASVTVCRRRQRIAAHAFLCGNPGIDVDVRVRLRVHVARSGRIESAEDWHLPRCPSLDDVPASYARAPRLNIFDSGIKRCVRIVPEIMNRAETDLTTRWSGWS